MEVSLHNSVIFLTFCMVIAAVCLGVKVRSLEPSHKKAVTRLAACLLGGGGWSLMMASTLFSESRLPLLSAVGVVETVRVDRGSRHSTTYFKIMRADGSVLNLNVSGESSHFHHGERIAVTYHERGDVVRTTFIADDDEVEGGYASNDNAPGYVFLGLGILVMILAYGSYRRNPDGAEVSRNPEDSPPGDADEGSMLHL
jgi:hypothetical protein